MRVTMIIISALALSGVALASNTVQSSEVNPIRKVVAMLTKMQTRVTAEGAKEKALFDNFMCYCKNNDNELAMSIAAGDTKIAQLGTAIKSHTAQKAQLEAELKDAKAARAEAKSTMEQATALRSKEAAAYAKESADLKTNIDALTGAIAAIEKGMGGAFLQTTTAATLKKIVLSGPEMSDTDRQDLMAFLSESNGYEPQSGQITGILKTLKDEMQASLTDATSVENSAIQSFDGLVVAKTKEVDALIAAIEAKSKRAGELAVTISMEENELEDTTQAVAEDKKFLLDLTNNCKTKQDEWDEIVKMRAAELIALADTIKILTSDDALELFKKTLPASSFIQLESSTKEMRTKALAMIIKARGAIKLKGLPLEFVELALRGKKIGFGKIIKMIDNMVAQLNVEQDDDDKKKEYCENKLDAANDKAKNLNQKRSDLEAAIASNDEGIAATKAEIKALSDGIKALDDSVAEATAQRKEEHSDYTTMLADNSAAKELLEFAKNRLQKFYNPKLYEAPPTPELSEAFVQGSGAPPPPPQAPGAFKAKTEENNGVIAMVDLIVKDLDKEVQTGEVDEKDAQKEYQQMMQNAADKRAQDSKLITEKESIMAELESDRESNKAGHLSTTKDLLGTVEYIGGLHKECDWLLQNYDVRKAARTGEIDALGKAKAVLNGADFSLVQRGNLRSHKGLTRHYG